MARAVRVERVEDRLHILVQKPRLGRQAQRTDAMRELGEVDRAVLVRVPSHEKCHDARGSSREAFEDHRLHVLTPVDGARAVQVDGPKTCAQHLVVQQLGIRLRPAHERAVCLKVNLDSLAAVSIELATATEQRRRAVFTKLNAIRGTQRDTAHGHQVALGIAWVPDEGCNHMHSYAIIRNPDAVQMQSRCN